MSRKFSAFPTIGRDAAVDAVSDAVTSTHKMPDNDDEHDKVMQVIYATIAETQRAECWLITAQLLAAVQEGKLTDFIKWLYIRRQSDMASEKNPQPLPHLTEEDIAAAIKVELFR